MFCWYLQTQIDRNMGSRKKNRRGGQAVKRPTPKDKKGPPHGGKGKKKISIIRKKVAKKFLGGGESAYSCPFPHCGRLWIERHN